MALLIFGSGTGTGTGTGSHPSFLSSLSSPSSSLCLSSTLAMIFTNPLSKRLHKEFSSVHGPTSLDFLQPRHKSIFFKEKSLVMVKASSSLGVDGTGLTAADPPSEDEDDAVSVENLALESKLQLKLEQKMRMKLAKKVRLRRKKLVRKRRMRKRGRWPPSKMSKNKNV